MKKYVVKPRLASRSTIGIGTLEDSATESLFLGRLAEAGPNVAVRLDLSHPHVIALFGKRGSGKSYTMGSILEGLCTNQGETTISSITRDKAVLLIDTLGIFQWTDIGLQNASDSEVIRKQRALWRGWDIKAEDLDVQIWIPMGTRLDSTPANHREFAVRAADLDADGWGYLLGLDIFQDRMGQLLNDCYIKVTLEGWDCDGIQRNPKRSYSLGDLIDCIRCDTELQSSYQSETRRAVIQQLTTYLRTPLFQDEGTPLPDILVPGRMNVLVINRLSIPLRLVILNTIIRRLLETRTSASEAEKNLAVRPDLTFEARSRVIATLATSVPPTWVALDEAQNILPSERHTSASEMLIRFVREGRNYGLSFMVATQQPTALDDRLLAQVDTLIAHKLTVQTDIDYIRRNLKSNLPQEIAFAGRILEFEEFVRSLDVGQALISNTESERAMVVDIRPRVGVHGGF